MITTLSTPPISPELALVDPVLHPVAPLGEGAPEEALVIDNENVSSNGIGAVTQLVFPASPPDALAADEASPETLLFRAGLLSPDQLGDLVQERVVSGRSVEEIVVERGWLDADTVARALGHDTAAAPVAAPAVEPHPDPFAIPMVELAPEPLPVAAVTFAAAPAPELQSEPELAPFAPPVVHLPVEPAQPEVAPVEPVEQEQPAAAVVFRVSLRFVGGECVEVTSHADAVEAKAAAQALVAELSSERGDWPFVGGRFVRPDAVLSVDVDAVVR